VSSTPSDVILDPSLFTATVTTMTSSFGDATRRKIYLFLRENPGSTVNEMATIAGVHANVVRHHLEKLAEGGYVTFENVQKTGVGRPTKCFKVVDDSLLVEGSIRRDALLVALLEMALERLGPDAAEQMAHEVGVSYGRSLATNTSTNESQKSVQNAMASIAGLLSAHGFSARSETDNGAHSVISDNCPFGTAAQDHPVLCAVDRGLIAGMLEVLGAQGAKVTLQSRARGDAECRVTT
jgi:predicted ArsR family transcriptional regulator